MSNDERREHEWDAWLTGPHRSLRAGYKHHNTWEWSWKTALTPTPDMTPNERLACVVLTTDAEAPLIDVLLETGLGVDKAAWAEIERLRGLIAAFDKSTPDLAEVVIEDVSYTWCPSCHRPNQLIANRYGAEHRQHRPHKPDCPRIALQREAERIKKLTE